jgi:hypothetical protein
MTLSSGHERPMSIDGAPAEEDVSMADAADRVDLDPEDQPNRTDPVQGGAVQPEDAQG